MKYITKQMITFLIFD